MTLLDGCAYRFDRAVHWQAGARRNLRLDGDRLTVPDQQIIEPVVGSGAVDAEALPAVDSCGRLIWLRPRSRQLVRTPPPGAGGSTELGMLDGPSPAVKMVAGPTVIWVLSDVALDRYAAATLQRLSPVELPVDWWPSDITSDGHDGLWLVGADGSRRWQLRHVDCWGRSCRTPVPVAAPRSGRLVLASTDGDRGIVVIDPIESATAQIVDAVTSDVVRTIELDDEHHGRSTMMAAGDGDRFQLLTVQADPATGADGRLLYQVLDLDGEVEDHQVLDLSASVGLPTSLVRGPSGPVVATDRGLARIVPRAGLTDDRISTFITPALVSPAGARSGWNRAELDLVLPAGTAVEITWASSNDATLIAEIAALMDGPATASLVEELDDRLPWRAETVRYDGQAGEGRTERLAALLDGIEETTLWLRVRFHTPPTRVPPALSGLVVRYPEASSLDDLPAVYRTDVASARELRRILSPYELVLDGLDETLAGLPARIDPVTAGDDWTDYLLGWLGFPPLGDLDADVRRAVLLHAPELLDLRGTRRGLELALDLVTGGRATVSDSAEGAVGWFLEREDTTTTSGAAPARLGVDTIALGQRPRPSAPGTMKLGGTPLGRGCPDPELVLAEAASMVTVRIEIDPDERRELDAIIDRLLRVLVPAHCRLRVVYSRSDGAKRTRQLDVDFRLGPEPGAESLPGDGHFDAMLHSAAHWQLGANSRLGRWELPDPPLSPAGLDHRAQLGAGPRLH